MHAPMSFPNAILAKSVTKINRKRKPIKLISIIKGNPPIYSSIPLHFFTFELLLFLVHICFSDWEAIADEVNPLTISLDFV